MRKRHGLSAGAEQKCKVRRAQNRHTVRHAGTVSRAWPDRSLTNPVISGRNVGCSRELPTGGRMKGAFIAAALGVGLFGAVLNAELYRVTDG